MIIIIAAVRTGSRKSSHPWNASGGSTARPLSLRQIDALYGPFSGILPNERYIDWDNPYIATDFQQPINGMECPWGNVQLSIIYDSLRTGTSPNDDRAADLCTGASGKFHHSQ